MSDDDWGEPVGPVTKRFENVKVSSAGDDWDGNTDGNSYGGGGDSYGSGGGGGGRGRVGRGGGRGGDSTDAGGGSNCYNCGGSGHMSRECPEEKKPRGGGGGGGGDCYNCGQSGHMSRDCTEEKKPRGGGGGGGGGGGDCYNCGQSGHMSRDCTEEKKPREGGGGGGGDGNCYNCGGSGHISRDCTEERKPRGGGGAVGENGEEKPPPYVPAPELEGAEAISDRKQYYEGSGINFSKYDSIKFEISGDSQVPSYTTFADMKLRSLLAENIAKVGYSTPTPIQRHATPQLMHGLDVMACAQTGSGKTAAFLLPVIQTLLENQADLNTETRPVKPECLILAPTRELAIQIHREARLYSQDSILRTCVVYGGTALFAQKNQLQAGCNILVATPGRLLQFVNEQHISLDCVQFFVLDEADRMLDMGFMGDVKQIVEKMPNVEDRTSGMFSATFPTGVQKAAQEFLKPNYVFVVIGVVGGACSDVSQDFIQVERSEKRGKLMEILRDSPSDEKVLVFCNAKKGADFLAASLSTNGISTTSIHGDRLQSQREQALREFTQGKKKVLVATAVAARGLDIPKVSMVVNYDLPNEIDEYVHRIGRTGRLGHTGRAISFYEESQDSGLMQQLVSILNGANQPVPEFFCGDGGGGYSSALNGFASTDLRDRVPSYGAPKQVEKDEEDWDD